jgi:hypothetical protein
MPKPTYETIWVAVRVQRGFVAEVRAYEKELSARRKERVWRKQMNPDYDEASVSKVCVIPQHPCRG